MQRDLKIDSMKTIAMISVVFTHIIQFVLLVDSFDSNHLYRYICSFQMPLFMFISGYLSYRNGINKSIDFYWLKQRFIRLIIPFLFWTFPWQVVK